MPNPDQEKDMKEMPVGVEEEQSGRQSGFDDDVRPTRAHPGRPAQIVERAMHARPGRASVQQRSGAKYNK